MIVRNLGISFKPGVSVVPLSELFKGLESESGRDVKWGGSNRRFYFKRNVSGDFGVGVVLTMKDQRRFASLEDKAGKLVIKINQLGGSEKLLDFNFFVINETNGLGIYQHYFQSCSPNSLGAKLIDHFRRVCSEAEDQAVNLAKGLSKRKIASIRKEYRGKSVFSLLLTKQSLEQVLMKFKRIRAFQYSLATLDAAFKDGVPIGPYVRRMINRVTFTRGIGFGALIEAIRETIASLDIEWGKVDGVEDINGEDVLVSVSIEDIAENFGEFDFDVISSQLDKMDLDSFATHAIATTLLDLCEKTHDHIFKRKVKDKD